MRTAAINDKPAVSVPTEWQANVLRTPRECDAILLGGKGSGKTRLVPFLLVRDEEQFGADCRALYCRQSHGGASEFAMMLYEALVNVYGVRGVSHNAQSGLVRFGRATVQLDQVSEPKDLAKHWGKNYSLIIVDEAGEFNGLELIDKLRASLRPPLGVPPRMVLIGNPGSTNHATLLKRYIAGTTPWTPTLDPISGRHFIWCPSTVADNAHVDQAEYIAQLRAACGNDEELLKAWLHGSFAVMKGGYFASVIDEKRNLVEDWDAIPSHYGEPWESFIALDYGSAAPAACYLILRSPGAIGPDGRFYPRDSLILHDEVATHEPGNLNVGMGYVVGQLAEEIMDMCKRWGVRPRGCADDACFARTGAGSGSIGEELQRAGVSVIAARKADRQTGWVAMRRLLAAAGSDMPGLFVARRCAYWWMTCPHLPRDPRKPEDLDSRSADHAADATRYGVLYQRRVAVMENMY